MVSVIDVVAYRLGQGHGWCHGGRMATSAGRRLCLA